VQLIEPVRVLTRMLPLVSQPVSQPVPLQLARFVAPYALQIVRPLVRAAGWRRAPSPPCA
jgi:hypothetical protein